MIAQRLYQYEGIIAWSRDITRFATHVCVEYQNFQRWVLRYERDIRSSSLWWTERRLMQCSLPQVMAVISSQHIYSISYYSFNSLHKLHVVTSPDRVNILSETKHPPAARIIFQAFMNADTSWLSSGICASCSVINWVTFSSFIPSLVYWQWKRSLSILVNFTIEGSNPIARKIEGFSISRFRCGLRSCNISKQRNKRELHAV